MGQLLLHVPRRYEDRTRVVPIESLEAGDDAALVRARVLGTKLRWLRGRGRSLTEAVVEDDSGAVGVSWFNQPWIRQWLTEGREVYLFGEPRLARGGGLRMINPEVETVDAGEEPGIVPVYPGLARFSGRRLRNLIADALPAVDWLEDPLPPAVRQRVGVPELADALRRLHAPSPDEHSGVREAASTRLAFDELLLLSAGVVFWRDGRAQRTAPRCRVGEDLRRTARRVVPFRLTGAQRRALAEIRDDLVGERPMARLLQGDVGSGKTVLAALASLIALDSGHQVAIMAPTELLAEQHHRTLAELLEPAGWSPRLLIGSLSAEERRARLEVLRAGVADLVIGTHALIQEGVELARLGLAVVDEQHRFGVRQRRTLFRKGAHPHLLVMTATPIPRSLAMTLYGDLDLSVLDEMPPGRTPVRTEVREESARDGVLQFLQREIAEGGRVYVVHPRIDPGGEDGGRSLEEGVAALTQALPDARVAALHGRMERHERDRVYTAFRRGDVQVLAATTVIEVGVDVPEASVMVVESADRFGLSQLHQLRGRVGRGRRASWCILMAGDDPSESGRRRLEVLAETGDGFEIAERDLEIRGVGELTGLRQWGGGELRFASLVRHAPLIPQVREAAEQLHREGRLVEVLHRLRALYRIPLEPDWPTGG